MPAIMWTYGCQAPSVLRKQHAQPRARGSNTIVRRDDAMLACVQMCGLKATRWKTQVTSSKSFPSVTHWDQPCSQRSWVIHMTSHIARSLKGCLPWHLLSEETIPHKLCNNITWVVSKSFPGLHLFIFQENHIKCQTFQRKIRQGRSNQIANSF